MHFEHQDWLGTERVRTFYNGGVEGTYQSLPLGNAYPIIQHQAIQFSDIEVIASGPDENDGC